MWKQRLAAAAGMLALCGSCLGFAAGAAPAGIPAPAGYQAAASAGNLTLYYADDGALALADHRTGLLWTSAPAELDSQPEIKGAARLAAASTLLVEFADANKQVSTVTSAVGVGKNGRLTITRIDQGVRLDFDFQSESHAFTIPVQVTLTDSYLKAEVLTDEIEERGSARILSIQLMPYFGAGSAQDTGYLFLPDGCGALVQFNNGKGRYGQYQEPVYGRDPALSLSYRKTVKETIRLPVFGIRNGGGAFLGLIESGAFSADILANVAGSTQSPYFNMAGVSFAYRRMDQITMSEASFVSRDVSLLTEQGNTQTSFAIRYYPLAGEEADWTGMAACYRRYLTAEQGVKARGQTHAAALAVELIGGVCKDSDFLGFPTQKYLPLTTYEQAVSIVEALREQGVRQVVLKYDGWMKDGACRGVDKALTYDRRLGGREGFAALSEYMRGQGFAFYPDVEFQQMYVSRTGANRRFDAVKGITGVPAVQFPFRPDLFRKDKRNSWDLLRPARLDAVVGGFLGTLPAWDGGLSVGSLGTLAYADYRKDDLLYRDGSGDRVTRQLAALDEAVPDLLAQSCNAYAFPYVSYITDAPLTSSRFDVEDEEVPFYAMVVSGLIPYASAPVNLEGDPERALLRVLQSGASPLYQWIGGDPSLLLDTVLEGCYAAGYAQWAQEAAAWYGKAAGALGHGQMTGFTQPAPGVTVTSYADGARVYVNSTQESYPCEAGTVPAMGFLVR